MAGFADTVAARWHEPDAGIWEIRDDATHHVHSKLMAWLALDRALRIAASHHTSGRRRRRWATERDALAAEITTRGFDPIKGTFTRSYGSDDVDAALLVLPLLGIEPADSPRVRATIDAVRHDLDAGGPLLYRYPPGRDRLWTNSPAAAYAVMKDGAVTSIVITDPGAGYTSPPQVSIPGHPEIALQAQLVFGRSLKTNGSISAITAR